MEQVPGAWICIRAICDVTDCLWCCRPGDSIHLGPGEHTAEGVQIRHPLKLIGAAGSTLRCRQHYADAALELWSNVKLECICVEAHRAFCVRHHAGDVTLSRCRLICDAGRFAHLYCAVLAAARQRKENRDCKADMRASRPAGSLTVEETTILGARRAVQCKGDGKLHDVRMLQGWGGLCFWFKVEQAHLAERKIGPTTVADSAAQVLSSATLKKRKVQWDTREWHSGSR